jgi:hypothetical protein
MPEAGATEKRTLQAVGWKPVLGDDMPFKIQDINISLEFSMVFALPP